MIQTRNANYFRMAFLLLMLASLAGCFDVKQDFTINPDGSGKVIVEMVAHVPDVGQDKKDAAEAPKKMATSILHESKGIEAWSDVTFDLAKDGSVTFKGTAYFRDLSQVELKNLGPTFDLKQEKNTMTLSMEGGQEKTPGGSASAKLSDAEIEAKIKQSREQWQKSKPLMSAMLSTYKNEATFHLPGKLVQSNNFQKLSDSSVKVSIEGAKALAALDSIMSDDALLRKLASTGQLGSDGMPSMDDQLNEKLFGQKGRVEARIQLSPSPLFDYQKEVAAAMEPYSKLLASLGVQQSVAMPESSSNGLRISMESIRDERSTKEFSKSLKVTLNVSGDILEQSQGLRRMTFSKAVDDTGQDLLKQEPDSRSGFVLKSEGAQKKESAVKKELELKSPTRSATAITELSGTAEIDVPSKDPKSKILFKDFLQRAGKSVSSDALKKSGIELTAFTKSQWDTAKPDKESDFFGANKVGENDLVFKIDDANGKFVGVEVLDSSGKAYPFKGRTTSSSGNSLKYILRYEQLPPRNAQLAVYVETPASLVKVPFKLTNIKLP